MMESLIIRSSNKFFYLTALSHFSPDDSNGLKRASACQKAKVQVYKLVYTYFRLSRPPGHMSDARQCIASFKPHCILGKVGLTSKFLLVSLGCAPILRLIALLPRRPLIRRTLQQMKIEAIEKDIGSEYACCVVAVIMIGRQSLGRD